MKNKMILMAAMVMTFAACNEGNSEMEETASFDIETNDWDKVSYSLGVNIGITLKQQGLTKINMDAMAAAFEDVFEGRNLAISQRDASDNISKMLADLSPNDPASGGQGGPDGQPAQTGGPDGGAEGAAYLEENAKRAGVTTTASGLQYEVMKEGKGASPSAEDKVTVHYHGTFIDGRVFDSSVERGEPATFPLNGVIKGWTEGVQLMKMGAKYKFFIPGDLAYGQRGFGNQIPPNTALVFEVELLGIN